MTPLYRKAIQSIESSGGEYSLLGPVTKNGDRAYGAYQVMGNNIPEWTQTHLGRRMTPQEFVADKDAQDTVFDKQFGSYVNKYGNPQDAASAWFTGGPMSTGANKRDVLGTSGSGYVDKFNKYILGNDGTVPGGALSYAGKESKTMPALSADEIMGPGVLGQNNQAGVFGSGLTGIGAALAGISSPEQAKSLIASQVAMQKQAVDPGTWSVQTLPDGTSFYMNSKTRQTVPLGKFNKPEKNTYDEQYDTKNAEDNIKLNKELSDAHGVALAQQQDISLLDKALKNPNVGQGIFGPARNVINKMYVGLGLGDEKMAAAASDADILNATAPKMALQAIQNGGQKLLPGSMSDGDVKLTLRIAAGETLTPEANRKLLDGTILHNQRVMEAEAVRQQAIAANGGRLPANFRSTLGELRQKWDAENKVRDEAYENSSKAATTPVTIEPGGAYVWSEQGMRKK